MDRWIENSVDPDRSVVSDPGLYCLVRLVCLNTSLFYATQGATRTFNRR